MVPGFIPTTGEIIPPGVAVVPLAGGFTATTVAAIFLPVEVAATVGESIPTVGEIISPTVGTIPPTIKLALFDHLAGSTGHRFSI